MKPFGYYWEIYHRETGEVVNDGFERGEDVPPNDSYSPKGRLSASFASRITPLFAAESSSNKGADRG